MGDRDIKDGTRSVTQRHGWAVPSATASGARPKPMLQTVTPCGPTSRSAGLSRLKRSGTEFAPEGRSSVQRSVRIDTRNGDRLGSGGYDDHDAPGYLLKGGGPLTPEPRSECGSLASETTCGSRAEACPNDGLVRQQKSFVRMQLTVTSWCS